MTGTSRDPRPVVVPPHPLVSEGRMRWIVAVLSLSVLFSMFGTAAVLIMGKPSLKLLGSDWQVVSLDTEPRRDCAGPVARLSSDLSQPSDTLTLRRPRPSMD
jgi:hypothetical protein